MARLLVVALLGAVIGAVAVNALAPRGGDCDGCVAMEGSVAELRAAERRRPARIAAADFSTRLQAYEAAESATLPVLSARFTAALALPPSTARQFLLGTLIGAIAERDPDEAIRQLSGRDVDGVTARPLGLAVLRAIGITKANIDRLAAALPRVDRGRFIGDAVAELTAASPDAGVQLALGLDSKAERMLALEAAAATVAEQDPYAALRLAQTIPEEPGIVFRPSRVVFQMTALRLVARASLLTAVDYVAQFARISDSQRARDELIRVVIDEASRADPLLALEAARQLGAEYADEMESVALRELARDDPVLAMTYADGMALTARRNELRRSIAGIYGETDPDAALAWARSLDPPSPQLVMTVLEGVARADPLRAIDTLLSEQAPAERTMVRYRGGFMMNGNDPFGILRTVIGPDARAPEGTTHEELIKQIGERLLALPEGQQRNQWVSQYLMTWSRNDARTALDWARANSDAVDSWIYPNVARNMRGDLTEAMSLAAEVPPEVREQWVSGIASNMTERGAAGAIEWLAQFQGQPVYEIAAASVAESAARSEPAAALALLATLPVARQIRSWSSIAESWSSADPVAARAWVAGLPSGAQRDAALRGLISQGVGYGLNVNPNPPSADLLALFSSGAAREEAMVGVVERLADLDPGVARVWLDEYLTDPTLRSRVEVRLRRTRNYGL